MLNGYKLFFSILTLATASQTLLAQNKTITIDSMIRSAEKTYPDLLKYESRIKAKEESVKGSRALMPPTISMGLDRFPYGKDGMGSDMNGIAFPQQSSFMFMAEQMITNPSKLKAKQNYLSSISDIEKNQLEWAKRNIRYDVKTLYYQRYISEKKLRFIEEANQVMELLIKTAEDSYPFNQASLSTIFKARAKQEELKNMKLMLESEIAESNIGLNAIMGQPAYTNFNIDTDLTAKTILINYDSVITTDRSDIKAMESNIISMEKNKKLMNSNLKPDFGIRATHMQMREMPSVWSLMGMVTIPIAPWSAGMSRSEVASMTYEIEAMKKEKENMILMADRMIREKQIMITNAKKQYENYSGSIIPAYRKNFEITLSSYKQTTADFFILLDAWEMLLMKKTEQADKELQLLNLLADYELQTGI